MARLMAQDQHFLNKNFQKLKIDPGSMLSPGLQHEEGSPTRLQIQKSMETLSRFSLFAVLGFPGYWID